jgi:predicted Fe-S protein YdhL (DUF1289 family)
MNAAKAATAFANGEDPASSPCTGICEIDPATDLCRGCFRSMDEIMSWPTASLPSKRAILAEVAVRRAGRRTGA